MTARQIVELESLIAVFQMRSSPGGLDGRRNF